MAKFKILAGKHTQKEKVGVDKEGKDIFKPVVYRQGDTIETDHDLIALFNSPGATKFERIFERERERDTYKEPSLPQVSQPTRPSLAPVKAADLHGPKVSDPDYDNMSTKDLHRLAQEKGVDVSGARSKAEIVSSLKKAMETADTL